MAVGRAAGFLLSITLAAAAGREAIQFRLSRDPEVPVRGWAREASPEGFEFEEFGGARRYWVPWSGLVAQDARRLRRRFGLEWVETIEAEVVAGHRIHFHGGGAVDGLLVRVDEEGRHWVKTRGLFLPYPGDRVQRVEEIEVEETSIYDMHEIYVRRLERRPPKTPAEHRDLADYMFDIGNWARAAEHYREAARLRPRWASELNARIGEVEFIAADDAAGKVFAKAKAQAVLHGDHDRAVSIIERYVASHPESRRRGLKVLDQLLEHERARLERKFGRVKHEEFDRVVDRYLVRRRPDLDEAIEWVTRELQGDLVSRIRRRLGLSKEEFEHLLDLPKRGAAHFASYWSGTYIVDRRVKSARVRDPESWWRTYDDVSTRSSWLKAYAAERMVDVFEVVQVRPTPCERCGGRGAVKKLSLRGVKGIGNEWLETCPRCQGAREDRGIAYR